MALVDMRDMLSHAYEHGYAVAALSMLRRFNERYLAVGVQAFETVA